MAHAATVRAVVLEVAAHRLRTIIQKDNFSASDLHDTPRRTNQRASCPGSAVVDEAYSAGRSQTCVLNVYGTCRRKGSHALRHHDCYPYLSAMRGFAGRVS